MKNTKYFISLFIILLSGSCSTTIFKREIASVDDSSCAEAMSALLHHGNNLEKTNPITAITYDVVYDDLGKKFNNPNAPEVLINWLQETSKTFSPYLEVPKDLKLIVKPKRSVTEAAFQPSQNILFTGEVIYLKNDVNKMKIYFQHPNSVRNINNHEFGHAIFSANLIKSRPDVKEALKILSRAESAPKAFEDTNKELSDVYKSLMPLLSKDSVKAKYEEIINSADCPKDKFGNMVFINKRFNEWFELEIKSHDPKIINAKEKANALVAEQEKMLPQINEIEKEFTEKSQDIQNAMSFYSKLGGYNEFFADVTSTLMSENPYGVSSGTHFTYSMYEDKNTNVNFLKYFQTRLNRINADSKFRQFHDFHHVRSIDVPEEIHGELWMARQFLWDEYLSRPTVMKNKKGEVLARIYRAILKSERKMEEIKDQTVHLARKEYVIKSNEVFIDMMKNELKDI